MKIKKWMPIAAGALIAGIYSFAAGKGIFNELRFKNEREAVKGYIAARRKHAEFSNLKYTGHGWMTILTEENGEKYILYLHKYKNSYIFSEQTFDEKKQYAENV